MVSQQYSLKKFGQRAKCVLTKWLIRILDGVKKVSGVRIRNEG